MPRNRKEFEPFVLYKNYTLAHQQPITSLCWSSCSRLVLTGSKDSTVKLFNLHKIENYTPFSFIGHTKKVVLASFSEDDSRIYSIAKDGHTLVWCYTAERSAEFDQQMAFKQTKSQKNQSTKRLPEDKTTYSPLELALTKGRYFKEKGHKFDLKGGVATCKINLNSNILVFGLKTGIFSIFNLISFDSIYTLQLSGSKINSIDINPSGSWIAFGSKKNGQLLVWEWKSDSYVFKQEGHFFDVTCVDFSSDGTLLISGGNDGKVKVFDTFSGASICSFKEHTAKVTGVNFVQNKGNNVVCSASADGTVRCFDLIKFKNFRVLTTPEESQLTCVDSDFSGEIICAGGFDPYVVYVWALKTGDLIDILSGHTAPISSIRFSRTRDLLLSGSWDGTVRTHELYSKSGNSETFENNGEVLALDLAPDDKELTVSTAKGEVYIHCLTSGTLKNIIDVGRDIQGGRNREDRFAAKNSYKNCHYTTVSYNPSSNLLVCGGNSNVTNIYDMNYNVIVKRFVLSTNRSLEGVTHKLNSNNLTEAGDINEVDAIESDSEHEAERKLPGTKKALNSKGKFNLEVKVAMVKFSPSNRSFAVASSEGIFLYSLDESNVFSRLKLSLDVTIDNALESFNNKLYLKALIFAIHLDNYTLFTKFINATPVDNIHLIASKIPKNAVGPLLTMLAKKINEDVQLEVNLRWTVSMLKNHGVLLKSFEFRDVLKNIFKSVSKKGSILLPLVEENYQTINFMLNRGRVAVRDNDLEGL